MRSAMSIHAALVLKSWDLRCPSPRRCSPLSASALASFSLWRLSRASFRSCFLSAAFCAALAISAAISCCDLSPIQSSSLTAPSTTEYLSATGGGGAAGSGSLKSLVLTLLACVRSCDASAHGLREGR